MVNTILAKRVNHIVAKGGNPACPKGSKSRGFSMIQIDRETFQVMLHQIMERFDRIDRTLERMNKLKECLEGDTLLDNYDLCQLLGVTKRTLARYRQKKLVTYYMIDGRTYYKASEVEAFLNQKGKSLPARFRHQPNV